MSCARFGYLGNVGGPGRFPKTTFGAIWGLTIFVSFLKDFAVDRAFGRKTPDMQSVCAGMSGFEVRTSRKGSKIEQKSLREPVERPA